MAGNATTTLSASEAVFHYKRKLQRHMGDDTTATVLHCLAKLERIPVKIAILQETGIGKMVNGLKKAEGTDEEVVEVARRLVQKWKDIVAKEEGKIC